MGSSNNPAKPNKKINITFCRSGNQTLINIGAGRNATQKSVHVLIIDPVSSMTLSLTHFDFTVFSQ